MRANGVRATWRAPVAGCCCAKRRGYLRVGDPGLWADPWAGIARLEMPSSIGRDPAVRNPPAGPRPGCRASRRLLHRNARAPGGPDADRGTPLIRPTTRPQRSRRPSRATPITTSMDLVIAAGTTSYPLPAVDHPSAQTPRRWPARPPPAPPNFPSTRGQHRFDLLSRRHQRLDHRRRVARVGVLDGHADEPRPSPGPPRAPPLWAKWVRPSFIFVIPLVLKKSDQNRTARSTTSTKKSS